MIDDTTQHIVLNALRDASEKLLELYKLPPEVEEKLDGSPVTNADKASSDIIMSALQQTPYPIMCEEVPIPSHEDRKNWKALWILDPLDGTKGYIHKTDEFAIALGFVVDGDAYFGAIAHPCERRIIIGGVDHETSIYTWTAKDLTLTKKSLKQASSGENIRLVKSRSRRDTALDWAQAHYKNQNIDVVNRSSALKFFDLVEGRADIYVRQLPSMEWDICAGHALIKAQGGEIYDLESNKPLKYNKKSLFNPNFRAISAHFQRKELDLSN